VRHRARRRPLSVLAALVLWALLPPATAGALAPITIELRFDGQVLDPKAPPEFSCLDGTRNRWAACRVERTPSPGTFVLTGLEPGTYKMLVSIDENPANPRRHPGDYEAQPVFQVTETGPERLIVDMARLIHLTRPGDNGRPIEGMLTSCDLQPVYETPRYAWTPRVTVDFAWDPLVPGAEYRYSVIARKCRVPGPEREVLRASTSETTVSLTLPANRRRERYAFRVEAWKDGRLVGDLYTHDGGTHAWHYRFRVRDETVPRSMWIVAGAGLVLAFVLVHRRIIVAEPELRRRRARRLAVALLILFAVGGAVTGVYQYVDSKHRAREAAARATAEAERRTRARELVAAFETAAPRPDWWDTVTTPYRVDTLGDLLAAWQGFPRGGLGERQFFKAAYQGILDHPDDDHVVATAIMLLDNVASDYPQRLALAQFGYERFLRYRARTDNCANCMVGDTSQALALTLGERYIAAGRFDDAIAVGKRLVDERGADVSPYKLAETLNQIAWAHWRKGERERAVEVIRNALGRYGNTVRADELRRTLAAFEREVPGAR
jgi:hypothetical protein